MDLIGTILWPLKWVVSAILVGFHWIFENLGLDPAAGLTWVLSIIFLTFVVRAALIPIFVRQIKSQRRMLEVAPQLKKIQDKYKGKKDQFSREAMSRETMALYKETGTNPLSSCLPLLLQMPIFFSLYSVLHEAQINKTGIGLLTNDLAREFGNASLFGAPLHETFTNASGWEVRIIAGFMIVVMTASQFVTQLQLVAKNMSPETKESPMYRQQKMMLYVLPLIFVISGLSFPLGVMFYWLASNLWTMAQQYFVIRSMPTPGSEAALAREVRLAKKAQRRGTPAGVLAEAGAGAGAAEMEAVRITTTQRQQPVGKQRSKKNGKTK
ncbi:membrane protein insertase YidC [Curtobacterium sp. SL109]|jgi:YidC/Oxa1 family membrane protein insertase|uniref:membrane protein insertase YidC n=1 Tax=Curtobacterium sp. SL109 TaxID=2994662 RepID=UPI002273C78F|nr:membrane protein insertase YidC [Curtobacterium sp. SL109]MCY1693572.1 membrane protein insertase YidC [Curtobacterium sp. SL109]